MEALGRFVKSVSAVTWVWKPERVIKSVAELGWIPQESVHNRKTYQFERGLLIDVFFEPEAVSYIELTLEAFRDPHRLTELEYEQKVDEFFHMFERAVSTVAKVLANPVFSDGAAAPGFPDDQEALWLALWPIKGARLMVQQKHEDKELPLRLCVVLAPDSESS